MTISTDIPREKTEKRFSVQVIDSRRHPMAVMQTDDEEEARETFLELAEMHQWRNYFLVDGGQIIEDRPPLRLRGNMN